MYSTHVHSHIHTCLMCSIYAAAQDSSTGLYFAYPVALSRSLSLFLSLSLSSSLFALSLSLALTLFLYSLSLCYIRHSTYSAAQDSGTGLPF